MPTLKAIKQQRGLTNADIARALGCSPSTASAILQGCHKSTCTDQDIERLATILGITFERCWIAICESYNERMGTPGMQHERYSEGKARVAIELNEHMPDLNIPVEQPRELAMVEGSMVVPVERRIELRTRQIVRSLEEEK